MLDCLSSGGGGEDDSGMKRSPSVVKKTGDGDSSHLAPLCKWIRLGHFLDEEKEGSLEALFQHASSKSK